MSEKKEIRKKFLQYVMKKNLLRRTSKKNKKILLVKNFKGEKNDNNV